MTRARVARKTLVDAEGNKVTSPFDAAGIKFEFFDPNWVKPADADDKAEPPVVETRVQFIDAIAESAPEDVNVVNGLAVWGLSHKGGDAYAGHGKSESTAWEMHDAVIGMLSQGEWAEGRAEGTASSQSMIVDAIAAVLEAEGITVTDEIRANAKTQTATPEQRKSALERADIKAQYLRISAERKAEQAQKAAERAAAAASAEGHQSLSDMLGLGGDAETADAETAAETPAS